MNQQAVKNDDLFKKIDFGMRRGVARALAEHKLEGHYIVVWRDGEIVKISPDQIKVPDEFKDILKNERDS